MSDLCHGAKAVPNGEKYKNRFDIRKWCQTRCSSRILGAATVIGMALSKRKNAAIRSVFVDKAVNQIITATESAMGEEPSCKATG